MAPKAPSQTTQVQKVELPKWVDQAAQKNYALAEKLGNEPFKQYKGDRVADLDKLTQRGINFASTRAGDAQKGYNDATSIFAGINRDAGRLKNSTVNADTVNSGDVVAGMLRDTDLSPYLNPYIDNVESKSLDALDRSRQKSLIQNSSAATSAGAFGGSRHGIVDAVTNSESARDAGLLSANLRKEGFDTATGLATQDINRQLGVDVGNRDARLNADLSNQDANLKADTFNAQNILDTFLAKTGAKQTAAGGIMDATAGGQAAKMQDFASLLQGGQIRQGQRQAEIDAKMDKFGELRNNKIDNLNLRLSALGMSPYGKTETTTKTGTSEQSGTDFGQMGMGIFSMLLGLSDDNTKTDKEKVGKLPGTDLEMWAFRYKNDPKTYPKSVGVMASDVEKKMPEAVHRVGKRRVINYGMIEEAMRNNG